MKADARFPRLGALLLLLPSLGGCAAAARGPRTEEAIHRYAPLAEALDRYIASTGRAPTTLATLVPQYVVTIPPGGVRYEPTGNDYVLSFAGEGGEQVACTRHRGTSWTCEPYY